MRIGIDYRLAVEARPRGIGRYIFNLVRYLIKLGNDHQFVLYAHRFQNCEHLLQSKNIRIKIVRPGFYPLWEQCLFPLRVCLDNLDVIHCTSSTGPLFLPARVGYVVTVHDVSFLMPTTLMPKPKLLYQRMGRLYRRIVVPRVIRRSNSVITVSCYAQAEIVRMTGVDPLKTHVVYHGLTVPPAGDRHQIGASGFVRSLPARYVLCVGGDAPHKNVARAIKVFARLVSSGQNQGYSLVVLGVQKGKASPFWHEALKLGLQPWVEFIGFVANDAELTALYRQALFVLIPSLNESFGMPALEAMACRVPVITSKVAAIPEIVGAAALLVDPWSDDAMEQAMLAMLNNRELRERFVALGCARIKNFSWERAAQETLDIYEKAVRK